MSRHIRMHIDKIQTAIIGHLYPFHKGPCNVKTREGQKIDHKLEVLKGEENAID